MSYIGKVKSYDEIERDIKDTLKKHSDEIFLECQHFCESIGVEINIPKFIPPSGLRMDYVIYVKSGKDGKQTKKNVAVVSTLLSLLGIGRVSIACPDQTYGTHVSFTAMGFGDKKYLGGALSLIEIENFDTLEFQEEAPKINDLRIWVEDNDGERTAELIENFLRANGYWLDCWRPRACGGGKSWRFWIPNLLPLTTISLTEHISMC